MKLDAPCALRSMAARNEAVYDHLRRPHAGAAVSVQQVRAT